MKANTVVIRAAVTRNTELNQSLKNIVTIEASKKIMIKTSQYDGLLLNLFFTRSNNFLVSGSLSLTVFIPILRYGIILVSVKI